jgi:hypothetical protein
MDPIVLQLGGSLVVAGTSAWFGSWLGVRHALRKLRNEKALERRLAWYEETVIATAAVRDKCLLYAIATRHDNSQLEALAGEMNSVFQTFGEKANKAVLYAPKHTVQTLDQFIKEFVQLSLEANQAVERGQLYEPFARHVDSMALSLSRFIFELAQELRKELALEKIELSDLQKTALEKR